MKHLGTQMIETERLILRRYSPKDAQAMYENWASDDEVTKFLMWPTHSSVQVSENVLNDWAGHYAEEDYYHWAIVLKEIDMPVGDIAVVGQNDLAQSAHIGYCIGRKWWHRGITSEALQAVIGYLFDQIGFLRIESRHDPNNPHSGAVMRKCGMKYEGTLRQSDWNNQGICDAVWYAILADEHISEREKTFFPT
ncbi:MAG: GNAT family N-acetyltransferase [Oscillospiraceae bacterium]|nr:GNAT family N-acetyltransferase [Oscillospiraceae bacterium]